MKRCLPLALILLTACSQQATDPSRPLLVSDKAVRLTQCTYAATGLMATQAEIHGRMDTNYGAAVNMVQRDNPGMPRPAAEAVVDALMEPMVEQATTEYRRGIPAWYQAHCV